MEDSSLNKWYAIYTRSKCEKVVRDSLSEVCPTYLPLQHVRRRWSDRFKNLTVPLLPSYVFVKLERDIRLEIYRNSNVISIISRNGKPTPIPERDIEIVKTIETSRLPFEVTQHQYQFSIGDKVRFSSGPLMGLEGQIERIFNTDKVYIQVPSMKISLTTELKSLAPDYSANTMAPAFA